MNPRPLGMENFKIVSFNAEGISPAKIQILADLRADILCLQETHKDMTMPSIPGMHLIVHHGSPVHGSAIYARDKAIISNSQNLSANKMEILKVETRHLNIMSVYKPPPTPFQWPENARQSRNKATVVLGDFNSHNTLWGYAKNNEDGEAVEAWATDQDLSLLHNAKDPHTLYHRAWKKGYNPDLVFTSARHFSCFSRTVCSPIPKSDHRPIAITVGPVLQPLESNNLPRFNFRKAKWADFTSELENEIEKIDPNPKNYEKFQKVVWGVAKRNIPRGCRKQYIPCLSEEGKKLHDDYTKAFNEDPFAENTVELGETLTRSMAIERTERWKELINNTDMTLNSKKAWKTISKLNTEKKTNPRVAAVTPNQVAHQLILNGKPQHKERGRRKEMKREMDNTMRDCDDSFEPFTLEELQEAIKLLKPGKAAGLDGITTEMIQHFGGKTMAWILSMINKCADTCTIPTPWRKAKVVALLKPGKDPTNKKSYRPISLLSILYKVYERMILARIFPIVEEQLTPDQAGFRPGKSCCDQLLNLTQYIEDGFEKKLITGTVFVDLTAAYDTVNHRILLQKAAKMIGNKRLVGIIQSLLQNRRFFVEMDGRKSRWKTQKNGLPQGSVLSPILFNIYTNDQPEFEDIRRFIYADDLCLASQAQDFKTIEKRLSKALESLTEYYHKNSLNANPAKTQVCAFHLNNHQADYKLDITWNGEKLQNDRFPVYLGVTLDRTLSFNEHCKKVKAKVATRNNILGKLANSSWGANPTTLKTTAMALCYSTAEYCAPVWANSCHARKIDPELNNSCRTITGTLRPTPISSVYRLAGIAPPHIRRDTRTMTQKHKQEIDPRHTLFGHVQPRRRLKSRNSFMNAESLDPAGASRSRLEKWREWDKSTDNEAVQQPCESLPSGSDLPRKEWVTLNRARSKTGRTAKNLQRWKLSQSSECACGAPEQTMEHLLRNCSLGPTCTDTDLLECNEDAKAWIQFYRDKI